MKEQLAKDEREEKMREVHTEVTVVAKLVHLYNTAV